MKTTKEIAAELLAYRRTESASGWFDDLGRDLAAAITAARIEGAKVMQEAFALKFVEQANELDKAHDRLIDMGFISKPLHPCDVANVLRRIAASVSALDPEKVIGAKP